MFFLSPYRWILKFNRSKWGKKAVSKYSNQFADLINDIQSFFFFTFSPNKKSCEMNLAEEVAKKMEVRRKRRLKIKLFIAMFAGLSHPKPKDPFKHPIM
jgi:hypothetical protein